MPALLGWQPVQHRQNLTQPSAAILLPSFATGDKPGGIVCLALPADPSSIFTKPRSQVRTQAGGRRRNRCGLLEDKVRICCGPLRSSITDPCSALRICYGPLLDAKAHQWQLPYPLANCPRKLDIVYNTGDQMPYLLDPSERLTGWTVLVGDFFVQQAALPR